MKYQQRTKRRKRKSVTITELRLEKNIPGLKETRNTSHIRIVTRKFNLYRSILFLTLRKRKFILFC